MGGILCPMDPTKDELNWMAQRSEELQLTGLSTDAAVSQAVDEWRDRAFEQQVKTQVRAARAKVRGEQAAKAAEHAAKKGLTATLGDLAKFKIQRR